MAFNLSTAQPEGSRGFNLSTAQPVQQNPLMQLQDLIAERAKGAQGLDEQIAQLRQQTGQLDTSEPVFGGSENVASIISGEGPTGASAGAQAQAAASLLSGGLATTTGGVLGTLQAINPFAGEGAGGQTVRDVQEALTFQPEDPEAQRLLQSVGEVVAPVAEPLERGRDFLKEITFEATGSPTAVAAVAALPEAALSLIPGASSFRSVAKGTTQTAKNLALKTPAAIKSTVRTVFTKQTAAKQAIADSLAKKLGERSTAGFKLSDAPLSRFEKFLLDGKKKVVKDPLEKAAVKQKFDKGVIAALKTATKDDLINMLKMVKATKTGKESSLSGITNRASDVVGDSLLGRFKRVANVNKKAGKSVGEAAELLKGKPIDITPIKTGVRSALNDLDIKLNSKGQPIFKDSILEGGTFKVEQGLVKTMLARAKLVKSTDAHSAHRLKKSIDALINKTKTGDGAIKNVNVLFTKVRKVVNDSITGTNKRYDKVNKVFSETRKSLDSFEDALGPSITKAIDKGVGDKALGVKLRSIMSNNLTRAGLMDAMQNIGDVAKKFGFKGKDNLALLSLFADELETVFKAAPRTGLQSQIAQATSKAQVFDKVTGKVLEKVSRVSEPRAFKTIEELLKQRLKEAQ